MDKKIDWERVIWSAIGAVIAILLIVFKLVWPVICISLIIGFAVLGSYACKHKANVKEKLKSLIDKI